MTILTTEDREHWNARTVRCPSAGEGIPLSWKVTRYDALLARLAGDAFTLDDVLGALAVGEAIRYDVDAGRTEELAEAQRGRAVPVMHDVAHNRDRYTYLALMAGASWSDVGAAIHARPDDARLMLARWAADQRDFNREQLAEGVEEPLGMTEAECAAVLELVAMGDLVTWSGA